MGKYETLLRVAELKNVTKAAQELGYSQPNISYIIRKTESELGVRLFNRGNRSILSLTQAGEELIPLMKQVEELEQSIEKVARSYQTETLRIGSFYSVSAYWIPPILKQFSLHNPGVKITIYEKDSYSELEAMLNNGEIDCSFYAGNYSKKFDHTSLCRDAYYMVVSRDHPLAKETSVSVEELTRHPFIMPSEGLCDSVAQDVVRRIKVSTHIAAYSQEDFATLNLVEHGLGISLLPGLIVRNTTRAIRFIPFQEDISREIGIICVSNKDASRAVKAFIRAAKSFVASLPH